MEQHRIIVRRHRPRLQAALVAITVGVLVIGAVVIYQFSREMTASGYAESQQQVEALREDRRRLTRELRDAREQADELSAQVAYLERSREIDAEAADQVRESLVRLQTEAQELREQIAFYQVIVSPETARGGIRVLESKVRAQPEPRRWLLELVLIQPMQRNQLASGTLDVEIVGSDASGAEQVLPLAPLLLPEQLLNRYSFRYFQELSAAFDLPEGFNPQRVVVTLQPERGASIVQNLEWGSILVDPSATDAHDGEAQEE